MGEAELVEAKFSPHALMLLTQYIVENAVGKVFDEILEDARKAIKNEDLESAKRLAEHFTSVRVLDPACGSGSFLIKAIQLIWNKYLQFDSLLKELETKYNESSKGSLHRPKEIEDKVEKLNEVRRILGDETIREVIPKIVVRHIYGNDLDRRAIEVAKVNIWLGSIKLAPTEFRFDRLPKDINHILPYLEMNLSNGDAVVGLPHERCISYLAANHKQELVELHKLREQYLQNPTSPELVKEIVSIKDKLRRELDVEFKNYLENEGLSIKILEQTKPLHWALEFWFQYFNDDGDPLPQGKSGFDVVIGNPPYERIQVLNKKAPTYVEFLNDTCKVAFQNYDLSIIFVEKGVDVLRQGGRFGYILPNKFMQQEYGMKFRQLLVSNAVISSIVNFHSLQVFGDATTYTCLLFIEQNRRKNFDYYEVVSLEGVLDSESFKKQLHLVNTFEISNLSSDPFVLHSKDEENLMQRLSQLDKLESVAEHIFVGLQTSADDVYIMDYRRNVPAGKELTSRADGKNYVLEEDLIRPLLSGTDVKRYRVPSKHQYVIFPYEIVEGKAKLIPIDRIKKDYPLTYAYLMANKKTLENRERGVMKGPNWHGYIYLKNMDKQGLRKLCVPRLVMRIQSFYDSKGEFYLDNVDVGGITLKEGNDQNYWYICTLLNSALLSFYLRKTSTQFRGGWLSCNKQYLSQLPIKMSEDKTRSSLASLAQRITRLTSAKEKFLGIWCEWSTKLKNSERTLLKLLIDDVNKIRSGNSSNLWTSSASFYPNGAHELLDKKFHDFAIRGAPDKSALEIYGISEDNREELIYEMEFTKRELMLHVYLSILTLLESRARVETLRQLLEKTIITVIQPDIAENTGNIMHKVEQVFKEWLKGQKLGDATIPSDVIGIDNEIENTEALIDALVFRLYGLDRNECITVLRSLNTSDSYQNKVLQHI